MFYICCYKIVKIMDWKIVETEEDLPKNGQLVLIYTNCSGQRQYYKPCEWDDDGFLGTSVRQGVYNFFAWCVVEPPTNNFLCFITSDDKQSF